MTALLLGTAAGESFETRHNHLGGGHILATVAHNLDIVGLSWWLVVNCCVSCSMENGNNTAECLEMAAVKVSNPTHAVIDIDWRVSQTNCHYQWQVVFHYPVILSCRHQAVVSQISHPG
jgi:hypothetical protein